MSHQIALILEDDPKLGKVYETTLQTIGLEVILDADGNQYRHILSAQRPSLVLLDMHLPFARGQDVLKEIRANPETRDTAVIVITADLFLAKSMESKGEKVLLKPFTVARLVEITRLLLPSLQS